MLKMLHWHISLHMKFPQQMEDIAWWKELFTTQKLSTSYARCILQFLLQTSKLIFIETIIKCDASWTHNYLIQYFLHIRLVWRWLVMKIMVPASQGSTRGCTKKKRVYCNTALVLSYNCTFTPIFLTLHVCPCSVKKS